MKVYALMAFVLFLALPLVAQTETEKVASDIAMEQPAPLTDAWSKWMVGEWEGWSEGPFGRSKDRLVVELGLVDQFLLMHATSDVGDMNWSGMGAMTVDPETGEHKGYWIDSYRGMYEGKGKLEGNKETTKWTGSGGSSIRIVEKVSEDKLLVTETMTMPDGSVAEGRGEMNRVKKSTSQ